LSNPKFEGLKRHPIQIREKAEKHKQRLCFAFQLRISCYTKFLLAVRQGFREELEIVGDGFYAENVSRILINSGQLGLPQVFWQPSEELIPEQYGIGPILFLVLTHKRIVSCIGFSDPLLSDFSLFILDGAAVLFIESEEQFAILFFVSIHHIPDIIY